MKTVQLVPAGAKQVGPGIFQMTRRGGSRGGHQKKHKHPTTHRRSLPLMSQSFVRYVKLLAQFRNVAKNFTAPDWLDKAALLLYMHGQNKHDKGAMNVAKTMLLDRASQMNPQIAGLLNAGAGDLGMLGLLGGFGGGAGGGAFGGGIPGNNFRTQSTPDNGGNSQSDVQNASDLIDSLNNATQTVEEVV